MVSTLYFGTPPALSLPAGATTPYMLFSSRRLTSYAGPFCRVARADTTQQDVAFKVDDTPDGAAADTFAGGTAMRVAKWYDQSGNGRDLVQTVNANRPEFDIRNEFRGIRPISNTGENPFVSVLKWLQSEDTLALDRSSMTFYLVISPRLTVSGGGWLDFTSLDFSTSRMGLQVITDDGTASTLYLDGVSSAVRATAPKAQPILVSWSAGATQIKRIAGVETTSATAFSSAALQSLVFGKIVFSSGFSAAFDTMFFAAYPAAHTSATMQLMEAELTRCFQPVTGQTKRVVHNGSSLFGGWNIVANQYATWIEGFGRTQEPDWDMYMIASQPYTATEYADRAKNTLYYDATKAKNVYVCDAPSNDVSTASAFANQAAAETWADNHYTTVMLPLIAYHKATGYKVVVPTIIARVDHSTANFKEYARLRYNLNARNGAVANGYTCSDRAPSFPNSADTTYYQGDGTHLTLAGTTLLASVDKPNILVA